MTRPLLILGWIFVVVDLIGAALLATSRGGDAATRGLGPGLGMALATLAAVAGVLLWLGRGPERGGLVVLGAILAAAPYAFGAAMTVSRQGLGLIYPSLRERKRPMEPSPQYAYPDAAGREAALAIVMNDYAKLDSILRATPGPDLTARDERGVSLLGLATNAAIMDSGTMRDLDALKLLLAAGAKPCPDDLGPDRSLIEQVAGDRTERQTVALEWLLDAGLGPDTPTLDGQPVLFPPGPGPGRGAPAAGPWRQPDGPYHQRRPARLVAGYLPGRPSALGHRAGAVGRWSSGRPRHARWFGTGSGAPQQRVAHHRPGTR
ncbi:MAG: hypothetical protein SFV24_17635 [Gemmatimonadales bacterium]|nr:hypothetical protein [Gemmatimonadales bacterium]